jgi:hypothetical protein
MSSIFSGNENIINNNKLNNSLSTDDKNETTKILKKMKIISSKKKHNYKNIKELENIYDSTTSKKEGIEIRNNQNPSATVLEDDTSKKRDNDGTKTTQNAKISGREAVGDRENSGERSSKEFVQEGFTNDNGPSIYKPKYEYDSYNTTTNKKSTKKIIDKKVPPGSIDIMDLHKEYKSGNITKSQYDDLFNFHFGNIDWSLPKPTTNKCGQFNKNCDTGSNIMAYIQNVINIFKQFIGIYSKLLRYIATQMYISTDGKIDGTPSKSSKDVDLLVNILHYIFMIPFSIFFAYNWFYIMFYRDETGSFVKNEFSKTVMDSLKGLLRRFLKCLVSPVILMNALMRTIIPGVYLGGIKLFQNIDAGPFSSFFETVGNIFENPLIIFIWLTMIILYMVCTYSDTVINALYAYMGDGSTRPYINLLYGIIGYDLVVGVAAVPLFMKAFDTMLALASPMTTLAWFLILLVFSFLMINFSGIAVIIYLYIMSYFALLIYSPSGYKGAINSIQNAFKNGVYSSKKPCPPNPGYFEKLLHNIFEGIYDNLTLVLYAIVFFYSIFRIIMDMKSASSKIILSSGFGIIVFMIVLGIVMTTINKLDKNIDKSMFDLPKM